jgi:U4/U6 small nuclear ribonucleoprotein PRP31
LELVDPKMQAERKRKLAEEDDRWFKGGTFTQVATSSAATNGATAESGGFKVPGLPAKKLKKEV